MYAMGRHGFAVLLAAVVASCVSAVDPVIFYRFNQPEGTTSVMVRAEQRILLDRV